MSSVDAEPAINVVVCTIEQLPFGVYKICGGM